MSNAMPGRGQQKDVITRLAETGEEALNRLTELPGGARVVEAATSVRKQVDDLTKRIRSLDPLERRVAELERRLDELSKPAQARTRKPKATTTRATSPAGKPAPRARKTS
jgi:hypothetical protein